MAKLIYRADTEEILGMWIMGLHAADLIHEASNAINQGTKVSELKFAVHAHPTLAEVVDEVFKQVELPRRGGKGVRGERGGNDDASERHH